MAEILKVGEQRAVELKTASTKMIKFSLILQHTTVNTAFVSGDLNTSKIMVQGRKICKGKPTTLLGNDQLKVLAMAKNFYNSLFDNGNDYARWKILTAHAAGVKERALVEIHLPLMGPINLGPDEQLVMDINFQGAACTANVDTNSSFLYVEAAPCLQGYEYFTPLTEVYQINANEGRFAKTLGKGVMRVTFINLDKDITDANIPFTMCQFTSDRLSFNRQGTELLTERNAKFQDSAIADLRGASVVLFDGEGSHVDGAAIDLSLTGANVTAGNNFVVVERAVTNGRKLQYAMAKENKHKNAALVEMGFKEAEKALQESTAIQAHIENTNY